MKALPALGEAVLDPASLQVARGRAEPLVSKRDEGFGAPRPAAAAAIHEGRGRSSREVGECAGRHGAAALPASIIPRRGPWVLVADVRAGLFQRGLVIERMSYASVP